MTDSSAEAAFIARLEELTRREDRAALAALRRGLGKQPGTAPEMFPYLAPWTQDAYGWREESMYLVASLFALHPVSWHPPQEERHRTNLGASLLRASRDGSHEGIERRFVAMLSSRRDDLPEHLRHAVSLCKAHEVPIHWLRLLWDVRAWDREDHRVQRDWARGFWQKPQAETEAHSATSSDE